jgi:hypothetical protein
MTSLAHCGVGSWQLAAHSTTRNASIPPVYRIHDHGTSLACTAAPFQWGAGERCNNMGLSKRLGSRLALLGALGLTQPLACSSDRHAGEEEVQKTGTLGLALEATAQTGNVYRLRNAFFQIVDRRTGEGVEFLSSEDIAPTARSLRTILLTGNYTVQLFEGWFLERVSGRDGGAGGTAGGAGTVGVGGTAGSFTGGSGGFGGFFEEEPGVAGAGEEPSFGGAGEEPSSGGFGNDTSFGGDDSGSSGSGGTGGSGKGGTSGKAGSGGKGGTGQGGSSGEPEIVEAQLISDAVQLFSLFGADEAFVTYQFRVGEEIVDFDHGRLNIGIEVFEDPSTCEEPEGVIDPARVLMETNVDALSNISLFDVFGALASNGGQASDPERLYQEILDSYASADQARLPDAIHCGDETTNGVPSLNGFPIECDRFEHLNIDRQGDFFPTAFVNRMDLAPANGAHCGQQRVIFANNSFNRMFMILEAQIPNPNPELGILGCAPLAQFWLNQNEIDDPIERGARLAEAFLFGHPELVEQGFGPFYTATNLTVGSGQIRTNQFDSSPWTLREFKLALEDGSLRAIPFPVAESPNGNLWDEGIDEPSGPACRENFLSALQGLITNDPSQMSFVVNHECKDAESRNDFSQDYGSRMSQGLRQEIDLAVEGTGLNADDIANRAQFAGSCIGCHEESFGRFLGNGVSAPFSNSFVHVQEFFVQCENEDGLCFQPSPALTDVFLPSRLQVMGNLLQIPIIPNPCDNPGTGGTGGFGTGGFGTGASAGTGATGGFFPMAGTGGTTGVAGAAGGGGLEPGPAPIVEIELPSADESIVELQEQDQEIREAYGDTTLSGRSAQVTH